jgi:O-methyltransferase involved in polyketide biosynthesis
VLAGVGRTALGAAAVRARESGRPDPLFGDQFAASFVAALPGAFDGQRAATGSLLDAVRDG